MAKPVVGVTKYGNLNSYGLLADGLGLPSHIWCDIEEAVCHSIAKKTWSSYKTAERMLASFCKQSGLPLELPVTEKTLISFVHWLAYVKMAKAATISNYLAGIRKLHVMKGLETPNLRTELIQMIVKGRRNIEAASRLRGEPTKRQPVTPDILRLIKLRVREMEAETTDKLLIWAVCSILFHGAFRGGELLCQTESTFDPAFTLLRKDIVVNSCEQKTMHQFNC